MSASGRNGGGDRDRAAGDTPDERGSLFACPGCDVAAAALDAEAASGHARRMLMRLGLSIFFAMNVMVFTMALWSQDVYAAASEPSQLADTLRGLFRYLALLFALPVLFLLGGPILAGVWQALGRRTITTDLLIMLGVLAAFVYSAVTVVRGAGHIYFEVGCMVLIFVTLGRWLEANGRQKTNESLDALARLLPETVRVLRSDAASDVPRDEVRRGDVLQVSPGERFGVDGQIVAGTAEIDQQILTGESRTVSKGPGDTVYSGTLNLDGDLRIEVTAAAGEETVSRLMDLIRRARQAKGRHAQLADRVALWFVPSVCLVAIAAAVWHGMTSGVDAAVLVGLAVMLIACPCALGLATPVAIWTALGRAARELVLFRSGEALEQLAAVRAVRFDKTGTLTSGQPSVAQFVADDQTDAPQLLKTSVALAAASRHSFSAAICRDAGNVTEIPRLVDVATHPGRGVSARLADGRTQVFLGSHRLMQEARLRIGDQLQAEIENAGGDEAPVSLVGWDGRVRGAFVFQEQLRPEARAALADCQQLGLDVAVLTGDHRQRAGVVARQLGVAVEAELLPEDKITAVHAARAELGLVAMVGDGLNDAPALVAADVGVAMGCGADLSRDSATVCLLSNDLERFAWSVALARRTVRIIRQNLFWAFAYNVVGIGLAVTGRLNPIWAALAMAVSSFLVVTNSLRLSRVPGLPGDEPVTSVSRASYDSATEPLTDKHELAIAHDHITTDENGDNGMAISAMANSETTRSPLSPEIVAQ